ncbi:ABC transporter ATP-binding protein [Corynebacterium sp. NPDC060344]|uniref:ABC transporter ATP-binding protein n=1 Tax=Corynebacterium sp. NPDC060344 TaxID=3347101 RepID=UPI0036627EEA
MNADRSRSISVRGVDQAWGARRIISGLDADIRPGALTAIIGPNGCGKSTLLKTIARIAPPQAGTVFVGGDPADALSPKELARRVAMMTQGAMAPPDVTVGELVARGRYPHQSFLRQWSDADEAATVAAMRVAGVDAMSARRVSELSGGQRQRVWLALALAQQSGILLLDEPTTYLDIGHQYALLDLVSALCSVGGRTIVAVLHDLQQAVRYADELVVMKDGEILAKGAPRDIVGPELIREVFGIDVDVVHHAGTGDPLIVPVNRVLPDVAMLGT